MDKRLIFILLFALFLFPLANAVSPHTTQQFSQGYLIQIPEDNILKLNQNYTFEFHIINISNGMPVNAGVNCTFHLYDEIGRHIYESYDDTASSSFDYSFFLDKGNFSKVEHYYYFINCNSSSLGGIGSSIVLINYNGTEITNAQSILYGSLFFILVLILIAIPFLVSFLPASDVRDEEGKLMQINWLKYFRPILWFTEWMMVIVLMYVSSNLAFAFLGETLFATVLFTIFRIMLGFTPIIVIVWLAWFFVSFFHDKQFQNMINRGIFPEGKL